MQSILQNQSFENTLSEKGNRIKARTSLIDKNDLQVNRIFANEKVKYLNLSHGISDIVLKYMFPHNYWYSIAFKAACAGNVADFLYGQRMGNLTQIELQYCLENACFNQTGDFINVVLDLPDSFRNRPESVMCNVIIEVGAKKCCFCNGKAHSMLI
jgi:hypothetical protein